MPCHAVYAVANPVGHKAPRKVDGALSESPRGEPRRPRLKEKKKRQGEKGRLKRESNAFPEMAVSLIYRTQKPKDNKRKSPNPICYAIKNSRKKKKKKTTFAIG